MRIALIILLLLSYFGNIFPMFEGDNCTLPETNELGKCVLFDSCVYAKSLLKNGTNPGVCGFTGNSSLVCCYLLQNDNTATKLHVSEDTKTKTLEHGELSRKMCLSYYQNDVEDDDTAIFLGANADPKEFRHMAAVGFGGSKTTISWLCGGSLISDNFILSAAHCADDFEFGPANWVRIGDLDLKATTDVANPQDLRIVQTYVHPQYQISSYYHDIALFKLEISVDFRSDYAPACLHADNNIPSVILQATGWGKTEYLGETSSHLLKAVLRPVDHEICAKRYDNVSGRRLKDGILEEYQFCAGDDEGRDTCPGDSGGPLQYFVEEEKNVSSHFVVAGITSFGRGCGGEDSAGVYTRVSAYVEWIENIVWEWEKKRILKYGA